MTLVHILAWSTVFSTLEYSPLEEPNQSTLEQNAIIWSRNCLEQCYGFLITCLQTIFPCYHQTTRHILNRNNPVKDITLHRQGGYVPVLPAAMIAAVMEFSGHLPSMRNWLIANGLSQVSLDEEDSRTYIDDGEFRQLLHATFELLLPNAQVNLSLDGHGLLKYVEDRVSVNSLVVDPSEQISTPLTELNWSKITVAVPWALEETLLWHTQRSHYKELLQDISAIAIFKTLRRINLAGTRVHDITALGEITALEELNLAHTRVSKIEILTKLKRLKKLNLSGTRVDVTNFKHIAKIKSLEELKFAHMSFVDDSAVREFGKTVRSLPHLKKLNLCGTSVTRLRFHSISRRVSRYKAIDIRALVDYSMLARAFRFNVGYFQSIEELDLSFTGQLEYVEDLLYSLKNLRRIYLDNKQMTIYEKTLSRKRTKLVIRDHCQL